MLTKLIQAIRLSAFFNKRYDLFAKALTVKPGNETKFNVASLIKLAIWSKDMDQGLSSSESKAVKVTKQRFLENSSASEAQKEMTKTLLSTLKLDKMLVSWLQNSTRGSFEDIPTDPQKVFDLFICFMAEVYTWSITADFGEPALQQMREAMMVETKAFDREWGINREYASTPRLLTLPLLLRSSLPRDHPLYLEEKEFMDCLSYVSKVINLKAPMVHGPEI